MTARSFVIGQLVAAFAFAALGCNSPSTGEPPAASDSAAPSATAPATSSAAPVAPVLDASGSPTASPQGASATANNAAAASLNKTDGATPTPINSATTPEPGRAAGQQNAAPAPKIVETAGVKDFGIFTSLRGALSSDPELQQADITVVVRNSIVTLTGTVSNPTQKQRVEQLARGVQGVASVKNELRVAAR